MTNRPAVIFDFDGTVALGDGPLRAYARAVEELGAVTGIEQALTVPAPELLDGYDVIRAAAEERGVTAETLAAAYLTSRAALGSAEAAVIAPAGLAEFLRAAGEAGVLRILATNAPDVRIAEALESLGVADGFDRIITGVGKPAGLDVLLDDLAAEGVTDVLSIGDIWRNDLAPVHRRGGRTALIGEFADESATPDHRAPTLPELWDDLRSWLPAPAPSTSSH
ncbi:HAD family hydrolase [Microbacterium sp. ZW T5_56]|uniref:HAD family hydrolase n=1 Tax=Microbacterium sp. ZW T5_56 TaxID=3378081 RepID=UPI0038532B5F